LTRTGIHFACALAIVAEDYGGDIVERAARQLVLYHRRRSA
jgi:hypothetical protein